MATKIKVCNMSIEKELKSSYIDKRISDGMTLFKIYDVCKGLLPDVRGHKKDTEEQKKDYLIEREDIIYNSEIMNKTETLCDVFINKIAEDMSSTLHVFNICDYIASAEVSDIVCNFKKIYNKITIDIIDRLLIINLGISFKQIESIETIAALFDFPIDDKNTNKYNIVMNRKQCITRRILRDVIFYISYHNLYGDNAKIDSAMEYNYEKTSSTDRNIANDIIAELSKSSNINKKILDKFAKLIENKKK
jgi:hypothetical protein